MNRNEIFQFIWEEIDGRIIGGALACQDEARKWISTFLASVGE